MLTSAPMPLCPVGPWAMGGTGGARRPRWRPWEPAGAGGGQATRRARDRHLAMVVLLGLGLLLLAAPAVHGESPEGPYLQALRLLAKGDFVAGVKLYYKVMILTEPLLSVAVRKHDLAAARASFAAQVKAQPADRQTALLLALTDRLTEDWPAADAQLGALRKTFPGSFLLAFMHGELALNLPDEKRATDLFGLLAANPKARKLLALAEKVLARHRLTRKDKIQAEDPAARRKVLLEKAFRHLDLLERDQARAAFEKIYAGFPDDPVAPTALIDLFLETSQPAKAEKVLATWLAAGHPPLLIPLKEGRLRYLQGRYAEAIAPLEKVLREDPANEYARFLLAESCFLAGRFDAAAPHFQQIWNADPSNPGMLQRYAACLEQGGKPAEAAGLYESALSRTPGDPFLLNELAALCMRNRWYSRAEIHYATLADASPDNRLAAEEALAAIREAKNVAALAGSIEAITASATAAAIAAAAGNPGSPGAPGTSGDPATPGGDQPASVDTPPDSPPPPPPADPAEAAEAEALRRLSRMYE
ncbi:MAG: tetratricopeptide repeat protein [Candidatus Riflebacteria bacterium]|nr:tetratricopeptide repeat protein [Candidatus Riflebacteria bacterium]